MYILSFISIFITFLYYFQGMVSNNNQTTRAILTFVVFTLSICSGLAQSGKITFPQNAKLPAKFQKAIQQQTNEYGRLFYRDSVARRPYSASFMLDRIDRDTNYHYIFLAEFWIGYHYREIIPDLIKRITNKKEIGLVNSADLIIWERIQSKQMKFYGHGYISSDDLFTIAGRANHLLTKITGEDFGHVSMYSTQDELVAIQKKWLDWLKTLKLSIYSLVF